MKKCWTFYSLLFNREKNLLACKNDISAYNANCAYRKWWVLWSMLLLNHYYIHNAFQSTQTHRALEKLSFLPVRKSLLNTDRAGVLSSGCANKMPQTPGLNSRHWFSQSFGVYKSMIKVPANLIFDEDFPFYSYGAAVLLGPHVACPPVYSWTCSLVSLLIWTLILLDQGYGLTKS